MAGSYAQKLYAAGTAYLAPIHQRDLHYPKKNLGGLKPIAGNIVGNVGRRLCGSLRPL
jgi:hypothetical protein